MNNRFELKYEFTKIRSGATRFGSRQDEFQSTQFCCCSRLTWSVVVFFSPFEISKNAFALTLGLTVGRGSALEFCLPEGISMWVLLSCDLGPLYLQNFEVMCPDPTCLQINNGVLLLLWGAASVGLTKLNMQVSFVSKSETAVSCVPHCILQHLAQGLNTPYPPSPTHVQGKVSTSSSVLECDLLSSSAAATFQVQALPKYYVFLKTYRARSMAWCSFLSAAYPRESDIPALPGQPNNSAIHCSRTWGSSADLARQCESVKPGLLALLRVAAVVLVWD